MKVFTAVMEICPDTNLYVGCVPGFSGAHTQGEPLDELNSVWILGWQSMND